jgi:hypothetical protein
MAFREAPSGQAVIGIVCVCWLFKLHSIDEIYERIGIFRHVHAQRAVNE